MTGGVGAALFDLMFQMIDTADIQQQIGWQST